MHVTVFSTQRFEEHALLEANNNKHQLLFVKEQLNPHTAKFASHSEAVCVFVKDRLDRETLEALGKLGVKYLALRSAGYDHLNLDAAKEFGLKAARVPAYSPYAVAEHAVALILALNRHIVKADTRCHQLNFSLDGLIGFDLHGKTVGIVGTGKIGSVFASIMHGFGCRLLAYDRQANAELKTRFGLTYTSLDELCAQSDIVSLHVPLTANTHHLIGKEQINLMKPGLMLINTGRGNLVDTGAIIEGLEHGQLGYYGMDVYQDERLFFEDHSHEVLKDQQLSRLMSFEQVIITGHQAFLTREAVKNISCATIQNLSDFEKQQHCDNLIA